MPDFELDILSISVQWPGASPEDVEANVIAAIETEVRFLDKVDEELREVRAELGGPNDDERRAALKEELGDLLFTIANLARKLEIDPEAALAAANAKFTQRFQQVEAKIEKRGGSLEQATIDELDRLWNEVKARE